MFERADLLGHTEPEHYLWPACQWGQNDPTKPMLKRDTAWRALRDAAGLHGLRFHEVSFDLPADVVSRHRSRA